MDEGARGAATAAAAAVGAHVLAAAALARPAAVEGAGAGGVPSAAAAVAAATAAAAAAAAAARRGARTAEAAAVLQRDNAACVVLFAEANGEESELRVQQAIPIASHALLLPSPSGPTPLQLDADVDGVHVSLDVASTAGAAALEGGLALAARVAAQNERKPLRRMAAARLAADVRSLGSGGAGLGSGSTVGACRRASTLMDLAIADGSRCAVADARLSLLLGPPAVRAGALLGVVDTLSQGSRAPFAARRRAAAMLAAAALWPLPADAALCGGDMEDRARVAVGALRRFASREESQDAEAALSEYLYAEAAQRSAGRMAASASAALRLSPQRRALSDGLLSGSGALQAPESDMRTPAASAPAPRTGAADVRISGSSSSANSAPQRIMHALPTVPKGSTQSERGSRTPESKSPAPAAAAVPPGSSSSPPTMSPSAAVAAATLGALAGGGVAETMAAVGSPARTPSRVESAVRGERSAGQHYSGVSAKSTSHAADESDSNFAQALTTETPPPRRQEGDEGEGPHAEERTSLSKQPWEASLEDAQSGAGSASGSVQREPRASTPPRAPSPSQDVDRAASSAAASASTMEAPSSPIALSPAKELATRLRAAALAESSSPPQWTSPRAEGGTDSPAHESPARSLAASLRAAAVAGSSTPPSPTSPRIQRDTHSQGHSQAQHPSYQNALADLVDEQLALSRQRFEGAVAMAREYAGAVHTLRALAPTAELALTMSKSVDEGAQLLREQEQQQHRRRQHGRARKHQPARQPAPVPHVRLSLQDIMTEGLRASPLAKRPDVVVDSAPDADPKQPAGAPATRSSEREYTSPVARQLKEAADRLTAMRLGYSASPRAPRAAASAGSLGGGQEALAPALSG